MWRRESGTNRLFINLEIEEIEDLVMAGGAGSSDPPPFADLSDTPTSGHVYAQKSLNGLLHYASYGCYCIHT